MPKKSDTLERLEEVHPRAKSMADQWREIDDVVFDKVRHRPEDYLPRGDDEPEEGFELRKRLARFKAEVPGQMSKAVGAVFSTPPSRPDSVGSKFGDLIDNADGTGVDLNTFLEDSLFEALAFGASLILVDRPPTEIETMENGERRDTGAIREKTSKGFAEVEEIHERDEGEITLTRFKLSQATNWSVDKRGELNWIRIVDEDVRQPTPDVDPETVKVFWEWDRAAWRRWKVVERDQGDGKEKLLDAEIEAAGTHNLGIVPIAVMGIRRNGTAFSFESPIRFAYHYDIEMFQDWADIRYDTYMHAHPTKYRRTQRNKSELGQIGPNSEILMEEGEDHGYLDYPTAATDQLRQNVEAELQGLKRASGIDPLGTSDSAAAMGASGRARVVSFTVGERRFLQRYSRACRNCETRIFEIAERWEETTRENLTARDRLFEEAPAYSQRFDVSSPDELIGSWSETRTEINSETFDRETQKKIVDALLPDLSAETREEIMGQIEDNPLIGRSTPPVDEPNDAGDAIDAIDELEELGADDLALDEGSDEDEDAEEAA